MLWERKTTANIDNIYTFQEAQKYCNTLEWAGLKGWRLPYANETEEIPSINDDAYLAHAEPKWASYWSAAYYSSEDGDFVIVVPDYAGDRHEKVVGQGEILRFEYTTDGSIKHRARCVNSRNIYYGIL